ncbi:Putative NADH-flavin reductase [Moraxella lacunata]|uniref:NADH-flavin reductase n=1 Tax=Moraxella lacunata TaxID=477 RepID=A0A378T5V1_MORLA|nr:NAD(P)H-binding protein [Moraxella lacunata]STZ56159.1 Putative NADH-flavin reductase [Moraxella lacunata]
MKKFAVIGATGLVGSAVVKELAERGHNVTAFARNVDKVYQAHNVQAVAVDVNSPEFADKLTGFDAVVNAFNAGWENPNIVNDLQTGHANILSAVKRADVPYMLVVGGAGSLNVAPNLQLVDTPDFPADVYPAANVVRELLNELRTRTDVNWAFLSPAMMFAINPVSFEKTGTYRIGGDDVLFNADGTPADISVADLAVAIADDIEQKAHLHKRFTVAN